MKRTRNVTYNLYMLYCNDQYISEIKLNLFSKVQQFNNYYIKLLFSFKLNLKNTKMTQK